MITVDQLRDVLTKAKSLIPHAPSKKEEVALSILIKYVEERLAECASAGIKEIQDQTSLADAIESIDELYGLYALN